MPAPKLDEELLKRRPGTVLTNGTTSNDEAVFKLLYLALKNISRRWTMPIPHWGSALNQFAIIFEGREPLGGLMMGAIETS